MQMYGERMYLRDLDERDEIIRNSRNVTRQSMESGPPGAIR
jgi:hypothetical protein